MAEALFLPARNVKYTKMMLKDRGLKVIKMIAWSAWTRIKKHK